MTIEPGFIVGRDRFIQRLTKNLGRSALATIPPARNEQGVPEFYANRVLNSQDKLQLFIHHWTTLTGKVLLVQEEEAALATSSYLQQVCIDLNIVSVVRWEHEGLSSLGLDASLVHKGITVVPWKQDLSDGDVKDENISSHDQGASNWSQRIPLLQAAEQCKLGIVWADYALAETGSVVLFAKGGKGRSVSLLPETLFVVFRADQIVRRIGEVFADMLDGDSIHEALPSSINIITGPSRSADIENDLTIGIHGPGKVYAVIIES